MKPTIDDLLANSAPRSRASVPEVRSALRAVAMESQALGRAPRRTRSRLWSLSIPVVAIPLLLLSTTGSADDGVIPDFTVPISYTTDTGQDISCSTDIFNPEFNNVETSTAVSDYFKAQNWTGVGQRIYDRALFYENNPAVLYAGTDPLDIKHPRLAWVKAEQEALHVPDEVLNPNTGYGFHSHCTGELR